MTIYDVADHIGRLSVDNVLPALVTVVVALGACLAVSFLLRIET